MAEQVVDNNLLSGLTEGVAETVVSDKSTTNLTEGTEGDDAGTSVAEGTTALGEKIADRAQDPSFDENDGRKFETVDFSEKDKSDGKISDSTYVGADGQTYSKKTGQVVGVIDTTTTTVDGAQQANVPTDDYDIGGYEASLVGDDDLPLVESEDEELDDLAKIEAAQATMTADEKQAYADALAAGQATPDELATIQGQLKGLNADIQDGTVPLYSKGAYRSAMKTMAQMGLGGSMMASDYVYGAVMESQMRIAEKDANVFAEYGLKNASNAQMAHLAKAAALSSINMANLNARQQANVENAKNFLKVQLTNMDNEQQSKIFNAQMQQTFMLSDQAAENAAKNFNASSENQVKMFYDNLTSTVEQYNAGQVNATNQFNAGQTNSMEQFTTKMNDLREQFNAANQLVVEQFNAQWKQNIATTENAQDNAANETNAKALLDISNTSYANLWNQMSDLMEWAWTSGENASDRIHEMSMAELDAKMKQYMSDMDYSVAERESLGGMFSDILTNPVAGSILTKFIGWIS